MRDTVIMVTRSSGMSKKAHTDASSMLPSITIAERRSENEQKKHLTSTVVSWKSTHHLLRQTYKVLRLWALVRETTAFRRPWVWIPAGSPDRPWQIILRIIGAMFLLRIIQEIMGVDCLIFEWKLPTIGLYRSWKFSAHCPVYKELTFN